MHTYIVKESEWEKKKYIYVLVSGVETRRVRERAKRRRREDMLEEANKRSRWIDW